MSKSTRSLTILPTVILSSVWLIISNALQMVFLHLNTYLSLEKKLIVDSAPRFRWLWYHQSLVRENKIGQRKIIKRTRKNLCADAQSIKDFSHKWVSTQVTGHKFFFNSQKTNPSRASKVTSYLWTVDYFKATLELKSRSKTSLKWKKHQSANTINFNKK